MATFTFLAKRGQHNDVARLLCDYVGKPRMAPYWGARGFGVMVSLELPPEWSKRRVDKLLAMCAIPGAKKPKNKPIVKIGNNFEPSFAELAALYDAGWGEKKIKVVCNKKMRTAYLRVSCSSEYPGYGYWLEY